MNPQIKNLSLATLEAHKKLIWPEIKKYLESPEFPLPFKIPSKYKDIEKFHWEVASDYPRRMGKYIRPTLLMLTCAAMGKDPKLAIKTAAAVQMSEEWLLVHDDIEDESILRRGKPTLHKTYEPGLAVNAGDTLQTVMWKILFDNFDLLGVKKSAKIINEIYSVIMRTELGQTTEMSWATENEEHFTNDDWYFIADGKSGYYSIAGPLRLGAIVAGASERELSLLTEFGLELGRCWQLVDDILDVTSDFRGLKQKGNDIFEGKRTILLGHLLRLAKPRDKMKILSILKKNRLNKTSQEVSWVIKKMNEYGSINYAKKIALKHKEKSERIFDEKLTFLKSEPDRSKMRELIRFILDRDY